MKKYIFTMGGIHAYYWSKPTHAWRCTQESCESAIGGDAMVRGTDKRMLASNVHVHGADKYGPYS